MTETINEKVATLLYRSANNTYEEIAKEYSGECDGVRKMLPRPILTRNHLYKLHCTLRVLNSKEITDAMTEQLGRGETEFSEQVRSLEVKVREILPPMEQTVPEETRL